MTVDDRYMVDDVEAAVAFSTGHFGFTLESQCDPDPSGNVIELFEPAA